MERTFPDEALRLAQMMSVIPMPRPHTMPTSEAIAAPWPPQATHGANKDGRKKPSVHTAQRIPSLPSRQPPAVLALPALPVRQAFGIGQMMTSSDVLLERQYPSLSLRERRLVPAAEQSIPSLHGVHVPSPE